MSEHYDQETGECYCQDHQWCEREPCPWCENARLRDELERQRAVIEAAREQARCEIACREARYTRGASMTFGEADEERERAYVATERAIISLDGGER